MDGMEFFDRRRTYYNLRVRNFAFDCFTTSFLLKHRNVGTDRLAVEKSLHWNWKRLLLSVDANQRLFVSHDVPLSVLYYKNLLQLTRTGAFNIFDELSGPLMNFQSLSWEFEANQSFHFSRLFKILYFHLWQSKNYLNSKFSRQFSFNFSPSKHFYHNFSLKVINFSFLAKFIVKRSIK